MEDRGLIQNELLTLLLLLLLLLPLWRRLALSSASMRERKSDGFQMNNLNVDGIQSLAPAPDSVAQA